jgi:nitrate reductase gamma subunit
MQSIIDFARGPLFRLCFTIMLLGLLRVLFIEFWGIYKAYSKACDKQIPWRLVLSRTFEWLIPARKLVKSGDVYSFVSILFHIGLIAAPVFLFAHITLLKSSIGIGWLSLPYKFEFWLTLSTIILSFFLLVLRIARRTIRLLSRPEDYLWLILILFPFVTGFVCANIDISATLYEFLMAVHVISADLIFALIPFTKIVHCVLAPFSQFVDALAWKFPARTDEDIALTLNKKGIPV